MNECRIELLLHQALACSEKLIPCRCRPHHRFSNRKKCEWNPRLIVNSWWPSIIATFATSGKDGDLCIWSKMPLLQPAAATGTFIHRVSLFNGKRERSMQLPAFELAWRTASNLMPSHRCRMTFHHNFSVLASLPSTGILMPLRTRMYTAASQIRALNGLGVYACAAICRAKKFNGIYYKMPYVTNLLPSTTS
jgi:hypothetical protein